MAKYITLNINFEGAPYQVSRQLLVPSKIDLYRLHYYIQLAMGWTNSHLHMFKTAAGFFSNNDDPFNDPFDDDQSEIGVKLVAQLPCKGDSLLYVYDFGDDWRHTVTHGGSSIQPRHSSVKIIAAVGACPTEDSGGVAHMPERSINKPNLAQIQQRLDQFIELTEQQTHDHERAFAFVMGDQDALDETDGEDFFDEEALAAFIAADEAEEFNEDELTPEQQQAFAELKLDMQKQAAQILLQQIIANMHAQQRYQHVNEFINKPFTLTAAGYLPQHEFPVNILYDMISTLIPALNEEPIPAGAWRDDSDHSERQFYFAYRYLTLFGIFGIWHHQATNDYRRFDTQAYQVTVTDLARSLLAP